MSDVVENQGVKEPAGDKGSQTVTVTVNGKNVVLPRHKVSGLEIKEAAIKQGVAIEVSFILQQELPNGHGKVVGNDDVIEVHEHERFTAIANDDNS